MKNRLLARHIRKKSRTNFGRIIVVTGARQTGKTTLIRNRFQDYRYISLEDPVTRPHYTSLSASQWQSSYPVAALDEIQKAPRLFESIKAVYDLYPHTKYLLLGSSQIHLLERIKESLAGRSSLVELFPLTLPERLTRSWDDAIGESKMARWLQDSTFDLEIFNGIPPADDRYVEAEKHFQSYLHFGGMPAIVGGEIETEEKFDWLTNYNRTYLQRDLRDLANLRDLEPFVTLQKALAGSTAQTLNSSHLARLCGISAKTAKRFLSYLELSYQVVLLKPWFKNLNKRLAKSPKVHFLDPGVQRALISRRGEISGGEFESAVVSEIYRQIKSHRLPVDLYHLRTVDGREVDLILELESGYVPIEIKSTARVSPFDARHLELSQILDRPVIHSFILSNDNQVRRIDRQVSALPAVWFLS